MVGAILPEKELIMIEKFNPVKDVLVVGRDSTVSLITIDLKEAEALQGS